MSGTDRKGFDWKEIAEVLRITRVVDGLAFWREIKKSGSKRKAPSPAIATQEKRGRAIHGFEKDDYAFDTEKGKS
jgi:hypothetical protein